MHPLFTTAIFVSLLTSTMAGHFDQIPIKIPHTPNTATPHPYHRTFTTSPTSPPASTSTSAQNTQNTQDTHKTYTYPPSSFEEIAEGYPLCGTAGYTNAMGNYRESTHAQQGSDLKGCVEECRRFGGLCRSVAFHERYGMCLWFDKEVQGTWLNIDVESEFVHWDLECDV